MGMNIETSSDGIFQFHLKTPVLYLASVYVLPVHRLNHIVTLDIEEVSAVGEAIVHAMPP